MNKLQAQKVMQDFVQGGTWIRSEEMLEAARILLATLDEKSPAWSNTCPADGEPGTWLYGTPLNYYVVAEGIDGHRFTVLTSYCRLYPTEFRCYLIFDEPPQEHRCPNGHVVDVLVGSHGWDVSCYNEDGTEHLHTEGCTDEELAQDAFDAYARVACRVQEG